MTKTVDRLGDVDPRIAASPTRAFYARSVAKSRL
jgi:hypothetical protein